MAKPGEVFPQDSDESLEPHEEAYLAPDNPVNLRAAFTVVMNNRGGEEIPEGAPLRYIQDHLQENPYGISLRTAIEQVIDDERNKKLVWLAMYALHEDPGDEIFTKFAEEVKSKLPPDVDPSIIFDAYPPD